MNRRNPNIVEQCDPLGQSNRQAHRLTSSSSSSSIVAAIGPSLTSLPGHLNEGSYHDGDAYIKPPSSTSSPPFLQHHHISLTPVHSTQKSPQNHSTNLSTLAKILEMLLTALAAVLGFCLMSVTSGSALPGEVKRQTFDDVHPPRPGKLSVRLLRM